MQTEQSVIAAMAVISAKKLDVLFGWRENMVVVEALWGLRGGGALTFFSWLGMMQRRKLGLVFLSVAMSLVSDSLYSWPTVRNMPFLVFSPAAPNVTGPLLSPLDTWSRPTILSTAHTHTGTHTHTHNVLLLSHQLINDQ